MTAVNTKLINPLRTNGHCSAIFNEKKRCTFLIKSILNLTKIKVIITEKFPFGRTLFKVKNSAILKIQFFAMSNHFFFISQSSLIQKC